jgi:hypothetical protein
MGQRAGRRSDSQAGACSQWRDRAGLPPASSAPARTGNIAPCSTRTQGHAPRRPITVICTPVTPHFLRRLSGDPRSRHSSSASNRSSTTDADLAGRGSRCRDWKAGDFLPPRCSMISAESSVSRPSRCAVPGHPALRGRSASLDTSAASTGWQLRGGREQARGQSGPRILASRQERVLVLRPGYP